MNCLLHPPCAIVSPAITRYKFQPIFYNYSPDEKMNLIVLFICSKLKQHPVCITSPNRKEEYVACRQAFAFLCVKWKIASLKKIGRRMGNRDHTTVIHNSNRVGDLLTVKDPAVSWMLNVEMAGFEGILKH